MAKRLILGTMVSLALILSPQLGHAVPTSQAKKKSSSYSKNKKSAKKARYASRSNVDRDLESSSNAGETVSQGSITGVAETKPLMRVIPQRDGRFLLEPLKPKKDVSPLVRPNSRLDQKEAAAPAGQGHHKFEPWTFQELILTRAKGYCGAPYSRGASLAFSRATDCSGFVQYIYDGFKIDLPRSSAEQSQVGQVVTRSMDFSKMLPGDLLFFRRGGRHVGHAGIYLGEGKMIHASSSRSGGVIITDLREPYYQNTFVVAKRVFEVKYPQH